MSLQNIGSICYCYLDLCYLIQPFKDVINFIWIRHVKNEIYPEAMYYQMVSQVKNRLKH